MRIVKIEKIEIGQFLTVPGAAKIMGLKEQSIRDKLFRGAFTTYKFGHMTLLSVAEIEAHLKR